MKNNDKSMDDLLMLAMKVVQEADANAAANPTSKEIQIVIVEPNKRPYKKMIPNTLAAMKEIVEGYIENLFIGETEKGARIGITLNEEGKLIGLPFNRRLIGSRGAFDVLVGNVFITAYNLQGDAISLNDDECEKLIKKFTTLEVYI